MNPKNYMLTAEEAYILIREYIFKMNTSEQPLNANSANIRLGIINEYVKRWREHDIAVTSISVEEADKNIIAGSAKAVKPWRPEVTEKYVWQGLYPKTDDEIGYHRRAAAEATGFLKPYSAADIANADKLLAELAPAEFDEEPPF